MRLVTGLVLASLVAACGPPPPPTETGGGGGGEGGGGGGGASSCEGFDPSLAPPRKERLLRTKGDEFEILIQGEWRPFTMIGVNMGLTTPGHQPGEFAFECGDVDRWLELIGEMGANSIRTYTLLSPTFYQALAAYQRRHPDRPLWLVQGVWLDELDVVGSNDYFDAEQEFRDETKRVIDAIHGNAEIDLRYGKAFGTFDADVSAWTIAFIVGHELEPYLVQDTNAMHAGMSSFAGDYLTLPGGTPMEAWVTSLLDGVIAYGEEAYGMQRPVSWSNWPTLDPLYHPTEPHGEGASAEDFEQLDLGNVERSAAADAGFFVSYHAYPYYPEFVIYDPGYVAVEDAQGENSYMGYLLDLKHHYADIPLVVAETGVPSSRGVGKYAPSGMHHGGHDEQAQGVHMARTLRTAIDANADGVFLFALMDEWFKRAWVVERLELPPDRRHMWHNRMNPEQNFGVLAMEPDMPGTRTLDGKVGDWDGSALAEASSGPIRALWAAADAAHLTLRLDVEPGVDFAKRVFYVGIDTYGAELGDSRFPDGLDATSDDARLEFVVRLGGEDDTEVVVDRPYDVYGLWHYLLEDWQKAASAKNDDGLYNPIRTIVNFELEDDAGTKIAERVDQQTGLLRRGTADPESKSYDSLADWQVDTEAGHIEVRIPWTLLNVTDPSQRLVLADTPGTPARETKITDGFRFVAVSATRGEAPEVEQRLPQKGATKTFAWATWDAPTWRERIKPSYYVVQQEMHALIGD